MLQKKFYSPFLKKSGTELSKAKAGLYLNLIIFLLIIISALTITGFYIFKRFKILNEKAFPIILSPTLQFPSPTPTITVAPKKEDIIPATYKIDNVPFTSQAPFANWDHDHNEACEEAAILMVHYFYQKKALTPEFADKEIMGMIDYQKKNWTGHFDLKAKEIAKLAEEYYGYKNTKIIYDISIEDIKKEIAKGKPVILPMAGRLLQNPYYRRPGPLYHALVAIGYTQSEIITNDPGTKRGKDYSYKYDILLNALHEWDGKNIEYGRKTAIILE